MQDTKLAISVRSAGMTQKDSKLTRIVRSDETPAIRYFSETVGWTLRAGDTGGLFVLADVRLDPGDGPVAHMHQHEDEVFIVLEGEVDLLRGDARYVGRPGDVFFGPHGTVHRFGTASNQPARLMILVSPPEFAGLYERALAKIPGETEFDVLERVGRLDTEGGLTILPEYPVPAAISPMPAAQNRMRTETHYTSLVVNALTKSGRRTVDRLEWPDEGIVSSSHAHRDLDELLIIIDEQFEVILDETVSILGPGDIAYVPRGIRHTIHKIGAGIGRAVCLHVSGQSAIGS